MWVGRWVKWVKAVKVSPGGVMYNTMLAVKQVCLKDS